MAKVEVFYLTYKRRAPQQTFCKYDNKAACKINDKIKEIIGKKKAF